MNQIYEFNRLFEKADKYYSSKAYSISLDIIDSALKVDISIPNTSRIEAYFLRSEINQALGKYQESISDLNKIIDLGYEDLNIYNNRGLCKLELKAFSEAKCDFSKAIVLNPKDSLSFYHRALAYHYLNKLENSHRDFKSAQKAGTMDEFVEKYPQSQTAKERAIWNKIPSSMDMEF